MDANSSVSTERKIRCKMCRRILAGVANLSGHSPPGHSQSAEESQDGGTMIASQCSGYFVQPLQWMQFLDHGDSTGKIICPNERCKAKVGNYDWAGVKCSCGDWVTPGFCIHRSKVDELAITK